MLEDHVVLTTDYSCGIFGDVFNHEHIHSRCIQGMRITLAYAYDCYLQWLLLCRQYAASALAAATVARSVAGALFPLFARRLCFSRG